MTLPPTVSAENQPISLHKAFIILKIREISVCVTSAQFAVLRGSAASSPEENEASILPLAQTGTAHAYLSAALESESVFHR
ncbi:hypothetical protein [Agrobacterium larrymoorei]|uniref:hypothetical protein n=1 Tax=Agrobacterium larrymoorei TaxID=160699 RepID=UPI0030EEECF7